MLTTDHRHNATHHAGFAPAPAEAHQKASDQLARTVDDELEQAVSVLEGAWVCGRKSP